MRVGENVDIGLLRDGKTKHVTALVQAKGGKDGDDKEGGHEEGALHRALQGADFGDAPGGTGVVIHSIEPGSPASQTPLRPNDLITTVNRKTVTNVKEFKAAAKEQASLLLTVKRGGTTLIVVLR
jgi:S1-C subfamily serine protease